jgi:rhomboid protease GluP
LNPSHHPSHHPPHPDPPRPIYAPPAAPAAIADPWKPWVTYGLIAANVAMFGYELAQGAGLGSPDVEQVTKMIALGANNGPLTLHGQPWRLVTAMFLHYGLVHIGMNMLCLYQIRFVERMLGRGEFLGLYLASGLVGGLASLAIHPNAASAGASGAVFGMFGAFTAVMVVRRKQVEPGAWQRTMRSLGSFFAINLALGLAVSGIDVTAHIGGLVVGFAGAFVLAKTARPGASSLLRGLLVGALGAAVAFGGLHVLAR